MVMTEVPATLQKMTGQQVVTQKLRRAEGAGLTEIIARS